MDLLLPESAKIDTAEFLLWWHETVCVQQSKLGLSAAVRATYRPSCGPLKNVNVEYRWDVVENDRVLVLRTMKCALDQLKVVRRYFRGAADKDRPDFDDLVNAWFALAHPDLEKRPL